MEQPRKADSIYRFLIGNYHSVDLLLRIPCTQRCSVERGMPYSSLIRDDSLPFSYDCTVCRLDFSS